MPPACMQPTPCATASELTGAELPVSRTDEDGDTGVRIVLRRATDTAEIGDCGFAMQVKEQTLAVSAPSRRALTMPSGSCLPTAEPARG